MAEEQRKVGYGQPPAEHRFQPGQSGNPAGRKTAGATIREWMNALIETEQTESQLRDVARDKKLPAAKRIAAERIVKAMEAGDIADFDGFLHEGKSLAELRSAGVNTELVKKAKITAKGDREIELYDRSRDELDGLMRHTELSPAEAEKNARLDQGKSTENIAAVRVIVPGMKE